jgi:hypothetical protein
MSLSGLPKDSEIDVRVSKIKPTDEEIQKKVKNPKIKPKEKVKFNDRSYQSYIENGFYIDPTDTSNDRTYLICRIRQQKLDFINRIDLSKGKFTNTIFSMKRLKAPDYDEEGNETKPKEWLVYEEQWRAKNWLGKKMFCSNIEGEYKECTKVLETEFDAETGDLNAKWVQGASRTRYYIPFTKKNVEQIIKNSPDADPNEIRFVVQIPNSFKGVGFRSGNYTLSQFVSDWDTVEDLARREGGANGQKPIVKFGGEPYK